MLICAAGDIHGAMDRLYEDVLGFEAALAAPGAITRATRSRHCARPPRSTSSSSTTRRPAFASSGTGAASAG
jgi:hypothetical protein